MDRECAYVVSGGVGRIWKCPLPRLDGAVCGVELDVSERVFSDLGNSRFGDEETGFERGLFIA